MGSKKAMKTADRVPDARIAAAPVPESEAPEKKKKKKPKARRTSENDGIVVEQKAPVEALEMTTVKTKAKANATSEIDDIFGQKKRKKAEGEHDAASAVKKKEKASSEVVKLNSKGELVKPKKPRAAAAVPSIKSTPATAAPSSRKKTEDGFTVYSAEELGFNKKNAGGSKLCPFDCDCCF